MGKETIGERGSVLIIIAAVMAILSLIVTTVLVGYDSDLKAFEAIATKKQVFYMSEGVRALATVLVQGYLMANSAATGAEIGDYLDIKLPPLIPAPFQVSPIQVTVLKTSLNSVLTSGPFKGMNGPITDLSLKFTVSQPSNLFGGNTVEPLDLRISVGFISMFQFMLFEDNPKATVSTGPDLFVRGRAHSNGDFCIGSSGQTDWFLKVTVARRLMANGDARCAGGVYKTQIATDGTFTAFAPLTPNNDNGCVNCAGTGSAWTAYAMNTWKGQAMDQAHGVQTLKLPGAGMGLVQTRVMGGSSAVTNNNNLRFIVDPVLGTDSQAVQTYKFASNADIRILNGIWYLKDPASAFNWPGIAIWSDHPGHYVDRYGNPVGQEDLNLRWGWPSLPHAFSYYEYDTVNQTVADDPAGVISYGNLFNTGAVPQRFVPGEWVNGGASPLCFGGTVTCGAGCGFLDAQTALTCSGALAPGRDPSFATRILNATRGGFRNGHVFMMSPGPNQDPRSHQFPVNFDVAQFQAALANVAPGELGSYFGAGNFRGKEFNGVVYITSDWPGSLNGFGGGGPAEFPYQGGVADANQIARAHPAQQQALPEALCSSAGGAVLPGNLFDSQGPAATAVGRFRIPDCANYVAGGAYPNVIRVVNGSVLDPNVLKKGLSVITNLPLFMTGDYNTSSNVTSTGAKPWVAALLGGDKVFFISNAWNDRLSRWDQGPGATLRPATDTTYNTALLGDPSDTLTMFLEDWSANTMTFTGSLVFGYQQLYSLHSNFCCGTVTYQPPVRNFTYDPHFSLISNQPPGTPAFPVSATSVWAKTQ